MKNGDRVQLVVSRAGFLPGANGIVTIDNLSNNRLSVDIDTRADGSREQPPFPLVSPAKNFAPFAPFAPFAAAAAPARAAAAATAAPARRRKIRRPPPGRRCKAKVGKRRCKNWTVAGTDRCHSHRDK